MAICENSVVYEGGADAALRQVLGRGASVSWLRGITSSVGPSRASPSSASASLLVVTRSRESLSRGRVDAGPLPLGVVGPSVPGMEKMAKMGLSTEDPGEELVRIGDRAPGERGAGPASRSRAPRAPCGHAFHSDGRQVIGVHLAWP